MKKIVFFFFVIMLSSLLAHAQVKLSGRVTDASDGSPLPFVSVAVKGATAGTTTDIDGNYTLMATSANAEIVYSFLGYTPITEVLNNRNTINIALQPESTRLTEVVVIALGMRAERKGLGYAVQDVKGDDLTRASNTNVMGALQGKIAGVEIKPSSGMPGASSQVVIRGARSFTGNNAPLYVIDGQPISSNADFQTGSGGRNTTGNGVTGTDIANRAVDIDPNEIESINVLRGQAAAALYGIRASNGVIVITTKSGKGMAKGKAKVSLSMSTSIETMSRKPDFQNTWAQGSNGLFGPTSSLSWGPRVEDLANDPKYGGNTVNALTNAAGLQAGQYYVPQLKEAGLNPWATPRKYNNIDDFFQTGHTVNTSINVSQATEKGNYAIGLGNATQEGIIPSTNSARTSAKAAADTRLNKAWKTGFSSNFIHNSINKAPGGNDALLGTVIPAPISYNLKGIPSHIPSDPYKQINYRSLTFSNPYWATENNTFNEKTTRFFGNGYIEFTPQINWSEDKSLTFKYQLGTDAYTTHYQDIFEFGSRTSKIDNYGITSTNYNSLITASYDMDFTKDLKFSALIGNEVDQLEQKRYSESGQNFNFGGWAHIDNARIKDASEEQRSKRTVGFFSSASLTYKSMVFLNATLRNDHVSSMPRGNRSFVYPSVSLGFVFTELEQLKNDVLTFGKIRASYAEVGQAGDYYNNYYLVPDYSSSWWSGEPIKYPVDGVTTYTKSSRLYDPNLKPQNTISYEIGAELRFFNGLFSVDYTYARQNVKDQIFPIPLAGSSGASQIIKNGGKIHTNSHELILGVNPIRTTDWTWNVGVNFTKMENYVDELADGVESIMLGGYVTPQVRASIGDQFPVIYGGAFKRDAAGRILVDENPKSYTYGMPLDGEPAVIGKVSPKFMLGANTSLRYKKLSFSATLDWKNGGQMYSGTNGLGYVYGTSKATEDRSTPFIFKGYKADGTPNNIQRGGANDPDAYQALYSDVLGNIDEAYIFESSFVKIRELTLNYKLPKIKGIDLNVSLFARNLLIWTTLPNLDPESSQGNTNMGGSFERFSMPQTSSYGIGINLVF